MSRCFLLFIFAILSSCPIIAQPHNFGFTLGAGPTNYATFGFMTGINKSVFSLGVAMDYESFKQKGRPDQDINWDELPEHHVKEGSYLSFMQFGYKYIVSQKFILGVNTGFGQKVLFRNCLDETKELGQNGKYSKQKNVGKIQTDLAVNINYCLPLHNNKPENKSVAMFGVNLGIKTGMIFSIGLLLDTRNYAHNSN